MLITCQAIRVNTATAIAATTVGAVRYGAHSMLAEVDRRLVMLSPAKLCRVGFNVWCEKQSVLSILLDSVPLLCTH